MAQPQYEEVYESSRRLGKRSPNVTKDVKVYMDADGPSGRTNIVLEKSSMYPGKISFFVGGENIFTVDAEYLLDCVEAVVNG